MLEAAYSVVCSGIYSVLFANIAGGRMALRLEPFRYLKIPTNTATNTARTHGTLRLERFWRSKYFKITTPARAATQN